MTKEEMMNTFSSNAGFGDSLGVVSSHGIHITMKKS
jgi:hypothetical protein